MLVTKKMLELAKFSSPDDTRRGLNCLRFEPANNRAIATDGHRLMMIENRADVKQSDFPSVDSYGLSPDSPEPFMLPRSACIEKAKRVRKTRDGVCIAADTCLIGKNGGPAYKMVIDHEKTGAEVTETMPGDGKFPNYQDVLPGMGRPDKMEQEGYQPAFCVNAKYLAEMLTAIKDVERDGSHAVVFYVKDKDHSIIIQAKSEEQTVTGLLMPLRM